MKFIKKLLAERKKRRAHSVPASLGLPKPEGPGFRVVLCGDEFLDAVYRLHDAGDDLIGIGL